MAIFKKIGRRQAHSIYGDVLLFIFLALLGAFMLLPFIYAISQSLKPIEELFVFPPRFFVRNPTFDNFINLFQRTNNMWVPFERYIVNSLIITIVGTLGGVIFSAMAAFPLAKFKFPGSRIYEALIIMALLFVYEVTYVPQYVILSSLHFIDTLWALILPAMANTLGLYLMKQFMSQLPDSLLDSASVDGASTARQFWSVVMPNIKPAWITATILIFQALWNRDSATYIYTEQLKNLPAVFRQISLTNTIATAGIGAAAAVLLMIPPVFVFIFSQSRMLETMAYSGLKG
ncbi:MAG: carbohydrate ABC transporter permease [Ruminiclostridium sp.]|nr:carbohydrate ABC transporter permease [Ruminiclostridium sp.]